MGLGNIKARVEVEDQGPPDTPEDLKLEVVETTEARQPALEVVGGTDAPPAPRAAEEDDLAGLVAPAAEPSPVKASAPSATGPANPSQDLEALVRAQMPGGLRPPPRVAIPASDPAEPAHPGTDDAGAESPLEGVDPPAADPAAEQPVPEEPVDPTKTVYAYGNSGDVVRDIFSSEVLANLLGSGGNSDPEVAHMAAEWHSQVGEERSRSDIPFRERMLELEKKNLAEMEAARHVGGGGGGLFSFLGSLVRADPRLKVAKLERGLEEDKERERQSYNRSSDVMRDRLYGVKKRHYDTRMFEIKAHANDLNRSVGLYNEAFLNADGAQPFVDELREWSRSEGIDLDQAVKRVAEGTAPQKLRDAMGAAAVAVAADPDVAEARKAMDKAERNLSETAMAATRDADSITRNFHDKEFDGETCKEKLTKAIGQIADELDDPLGEDESRKKLKERMREMADRIRAAFEALMERILNALGAGPRK